MNTLSTFSFSMSNQTEYSTILRYNWISQQITKYLGVSLYVCCLLGTLMNMITFARRRYHSRSCSLYLSVASFFDFLHLHLGPVSNILQYGFDYDWTTYSNLFCKLKTYGGFIFASVSATLITIAGIDRYVLSSRNTSRWKYCSRPVAVRCVLSTIVFWIIVSIPLLFCYTCFSHASHNEQLICANPSRTNTCLLVQMLHMCFFNGFLPPLVMMFFGCLTCQNVRQLRERSLLKSARLHQINYQLTSMLVLQTIKSSFTSIPYAIFNCYLLLVRNMPKSPLHQAKESLTHQVAYLLFWSNYTSFFIYLYSSDIFRDQWIRAMDSILCGWLRKRRRGASFRSESNRLTTLPSLE